MRIFKSEGTAIVESAIVIPIIILTITTMLTVGITMSYRVRQEADRNAEYSDKVISPIMPPEQLLRLKLLGMEIIWSD